MVPLLVGWLFDGVHLLHVVGDDHAGHSRSSLAKAQGAVDKVSDLVGNGCHADVFADDVLEQGDQVYFLLIVTGECAAIPLSTIATTGA